MNKHKYSTYALFFFIILLVVAIIAAGFDSTELDDVCNTDGKILKRVSGLWGCSDDATGGGANSTIYNITNNITTTYNYTFNITNNITTTYNYTNNITNNITNDVNQIMHITFLAGPETWTNMPAGANRFDQSRYAKILNLSGFTEFRYGIGYAAVCAAGAVIYLRYDNDAVGVTGDTNASSSNSYLPCDSATLWTRRSDWEALPNQLTEGTDDTLEFWGVGGDGVADPQFRELWLEVR